VVFFCLRGGGEVAHSTRLDIYNKATIERRECDEVAYYNFACRTERFKHSPIVYAIGKEGLYIV
jgi:hypothetical protein